MKQKKVTLVFIFSFLILVSVNAQNIFKDWAKTPPMGWNSWDCYGPTVTETEVRNNADYMSNNLKRFGWNYIVVDIRWYVQNEKTGGYNQSDPIYTMDEYGRYQPAVNRFPSAAGGVGFKKLADYIHKKGLKFGIHIMRGVPVQAVKNKLAIKGTELTADKISSTDLQCKWLSDNYTIDARKPGAQEYYDSIMELYASWGVDFIKIDDLSRPYHKSEIELIRRAIDKTGRKIVFSTSPGETPVNQAEHVRANANMWRMVDDLWDTWPHLTHLFNIAEKWFPYASAGNWPDCDMIPLGRISIRGEAGAERMSRLTRDEQLVLMSFFAIFRSPLMFGGDLPSLDPFTKSLLTNKAVLSMHRKSTGLKFILNDKNAVVVTSENLKTKEHYLLVINLSNGQIPKEFSVGLNQLPIKKAHDFTDMWSGHSNPIQGDKITVQLKPHSCALYAIK